MKMLVISDIHANVDSLHAVWAKESDADVILCAGDITDWGFHPHEVIAWLREHNAICVHGNHDLHISRLYDSGKREELGKETNYSSWCVNHMTDEDADWLRALPETQHVTVDGIAYCMRHAVEVCEDKNTIREYLGQYISLPMFDQLWTRFEGSREVEKHRLVLGHSHNCYTLQAKWNEMYLNPGSMHYRLGGNAGTHGADYITIVDGAVTLKHVDYPTAHLRALLEETNFSEDIKRPARVYAGSEVD